MTEALTPREEDIALAGEYVLGVLDLSARAAVEQRLRSDAAFAALVAEWERDFSAMNESFAAHPVPDLMPQIEARLFGKAAPPARRGLGSLWRFLAGVVAAGAVAVAVLVLLPPSVPPAPDLTATLAADGQPLSFTASWDGETRELLVRRTAGDAAAAGQVHELWVIAGDQPPVSLGLLDTAELRRALDVLPQGAVLAVSLEPAGGSTTGAPTGPVLVTGVVGL
jgi:anti-sigma-K factor RskA